MLDSGVTVLLALALYCTPGLLFTRRLPLSPAERVVVAVAVSIAVAQAALTALALANLDAAAVLVVAAGANLLGWRLAPAEDAMRAAPHPHRGEVGLVLLAASATVLAAWGATDDPTFRIYDAVALWAPLAQSIALTGDATPTFLTSLTEGAPPSVALLAGAPMRVAASFTPGVAQWFHPLATGLTVLSAGLIARRLGTAAAGYLGALLVLLTPLLGRGVYFHDDLVAAFLVAAATLAALTAGGRRGWAIVGLCAGAAVGLKYLGVLVALPVLGVLWVRRPSWRSGVAMIVAALVAIPWYVGNALRFGSPFHPFLGDRFVDDSRFERILADHDAFLASVGPDRLHLAGYLWLGCLGAGLVLALVLPLVRRWRSPDATGPPGAATVSWLAVASVGGVVVWSAFSFGTRHLLIITPVAAGAVAGAVCASSATHRTWTRPGAAATIAVAAVLVVGSALAIHRDLRGGDAAATWGTGVSELAQGKWSRLATRRTHTDTLDAFGTVGRLWRVLQDEDPTAKVLSFDAREWYIPQEIIPADDEAAFAFYDAGSAEETVRRLDAAGVGYVLTRRTDRHHPIAHRYAPWRDLGSDERYELVAERGDEALYRLRPPAEE